MSAPAGAAGTAPAAGGRAAAVAAVAAAAFLFGTTFAVVQDAVTTAGPVPFLAVRFLVGAAVLAPLALRRGGARQGVLWRDGAVAGAVLAFAYVAQTVGLQWTTASASAFITYLLVVIVPLLVAVRARRLPPRSTVAGVALAVAGLALLTGAGVGLGRGEVLSLACAVGFAVHILVLARVAPRHPVVALTFVQAAVVGVVLVGRVCSPAATTWGAGPGWPPSTPVPPSPPAPSPCRCTASAAWGPPRRPWCSCSSRCSPWWWPRGWASGWAPAPPSAER